LVCCAELLFGEEVRGEIAVDWNGTPGHSGALLDCEAAGERGLIGEVLGVRWGRAHD